MDLLTLLSEMTEGVSDLHLVAGQPPVFRKDGHLIRREGPVLSKDMLVEELVMPHLSERHRHLVLNSNNSVLTTVLYGQRRFRMHVFHERGGVSATIRIVPNKVPTLDELGLPEGPRELLRKFTKILRGIIFVTGPAGSGKTTTLASLVEEINRTRGERIMTLENPIEYVFESKESLITQQEFGTDFFDLPAALRDVFYADPDIVVISELKNLEVLHLALSLAETGHLIFAPLSSPNVSDALTRLVEAFPEAMRPEIRRLLSNNVQAVIAQSLLPRTGRPGRIALHEILIGTPRVRQLIRDGQSDLTVAIEGGREIGMQTMDDALVKAVEAGEISREMALSRLIDRSRLEALSSN
ncbi:MAG: ATPase, T2SS/T4P/T4SS family [Armatimonas sp.]